MAGLVDGAFGLGAAVGLPVQSRLIDRLGQRRVLLPLAAIDAAATFVLVALTEAGAPTAGLMACALIGGFAIPNVGAALLPLGFLPALAAPSVLVMAFLILPAGLLIAPLGPPHARAAAARRDRLTLHRKVFCDTVTLRRKVSRRSAARCMPAKRIYPVALGWLGLAWLYGDAPIGAAAVALLASGTAIVAIEPSEPWVWAQLTMALLLLAAGLVERAWEQQ